MKKLSLVLLSCLLSLHTFAQAKQDGQIGQRTIKFLDQSRNRPLITEIWYPTHDTLKKDDKKFSAFAREYTVRDAKLPTKKLPLILLSHGTGGERKSLEWMAQALVKNGFIVAAVDHWGNTNNNKIPLQFFEIWQRPQDISFILSALLKDTEFKSVIDSQKIGAAGFSVGGYTVLALAGAVADWKIALHYYRTIGQKEIQFPEFPHLEKMLYDSTLIADSKHVPVLKDNRIKAFFSICPGSGPAFTSIDQVKDIDKPVFIIGAQSDSLANVKQNARHYHALIPKSHYYEFSGKTGHYVMLAEAIDEVKKEEPVPFVDDPTVNRHQVHLKVNNLAVKFFKEILK